MALPTRDGVELATLEEQFIEIFHVIRWDIMAAEKDGFDHFMLKEIYRQPALYLVIRWESAFHLGEISYFTPERLTLIVEKIKST